MNTGKLNRRISYTTSGTFISDGFGGKTQSVAGASTETWCSAKQLSMREVILYGLPVDFKTFEFAFRYEIGTLITNGMKLIYEGKDYRAVQILEVDEAKREVRIIASNQ